MGSSSFRVYILQLLCLFRTCKITSKEKGVLSKTLHQVKGDAGYVWMPSTYGKLPVREKYLQWQFPALPFRWKSDTKNAAGPCLHFGLIFQLKNTELAKIKLYTIHIYITINLKKDKIKCE